MHLGRVHHRRARGGGERRQLDATTVNACAYSVRVERRKQFDRRWDGPRRLYVVSVMRERGGTFVAV
jgi:hypothetical protein